MKKDNIDTAFPAVMPNGLSTSGMTLRDWFAGQAMTALRECDLGTLKFADVAEFAYRIADAMLKEREK